jgi:hypothetical protein
MRKSLLVSVLSILLSDVRGVLATDIPEPPPLDCSGETHSLLLLDSSVVLTQVKWRIPDSGATGCGSSIAHRKDTGHFWFFNAENIELTCKALDGRALTGTYWVFCGSLTNVEWWLTALDNANPSQSKIYYGRPGTLTSFADTSALRPGNNHPPRWVNSYFCGKEATSVLRPGSTTGFRLTPVDPDGDPLFAMARLIPGSGLTLKTSWNNPVASEAEIEIEILYGAEVPLRSKVEVAITDNVSLLPTLCIIDLVTVITE